MGQKNQYMDSLEVNPRVVCGVWIKSLNHTVFTSGDSHFQLCSPEDRILLFPSGFAVISKDLCEIFSIPVPSYAS